MRRSPVRFRVVAPEKWPYLLQKQHDTAILCLAFHDKSGRKPICGEKIKRRLWINFPDEMYERLEKVKKWTGKPLAEIARDGILAEVEAYEEAMK